MGSLVSLVVFVGVIAFVVVLIETRDPQHALVRALCWMGAVAVTIAWVFGLLILALILFPLWLIPVLGWMLGARIVKGYMNLWVRIGAMLGFRFRYALSMAPPAPSPTTEPSYVDDDFVGKVDDSAHWTYDTAKDIRDAGSGDDSG